MLLIEVHDAVGETNSDKRTALIDVRLAEPCRAPKGGPVDLGKDEPAPRSNVVEMLEHLAPQDVDAGVRDQDPVLDAPL